MRSSIHANEEKRNAKPKYRKARMEHHNLDHMTKEIDRSGNRVVIGLILSALIVASSLIIRTGGDHWWISVPVYVVSSFLGLWLIYGIFRSGSL